MTMIDQFQYDAIRNYVDVARKPFDEEALPNTDYRGLPNDIKDLIRSLPVSTHELNFKSGEGFFEYFLDGNQQFYLWVSPYTGRTYFIDTQGYKYARYVGQLLNYEIPHSITISSRGVASL